MNDDELKQLFRNNEGVTPSDDAKQRVIREAVAVFEREKDHRVQKKSFFFQGILARLRPRGTGNPKPEDKPMQTFNRPWIFGGAATAAICVFAVLLMDFQSSNPVVREMDDQIVVAAPELALSETDLAKSENVAEPVEEQEAVVLTGIRKSLHDSMDLKREAGGNVEAISAEDVGRFPDTNLAESLQRVVPGSAAEKKVFAQRSSEAVGEPPRQEFRDDFESFEINPVKLTAESPVSTFSIDVDTASYSFVRRELNQGRLPQKDAVRIEEMLNYFDYAYPAPKNKKQPFATNVTVIDAPWMKERKLMRIGIKGYELPRAAQPKSNLVFLLDVSGSMNSPDKLPLVKQSMNLLLSQLHPDDSVAIVVYAGAAGTVLEPTKVKEKNKILAALNRLSAGGSTAGVQGIQLAYQLAELNFDKNAVNRIILATDGDFNVGIVGREELKGFIERKRDAGIYLSVLGFGQGNYHDHLMQTLAQNGNGIAAYIDTLSEAQKVLVDEATSSLFPIAKDVKIQVEFNPATVKEYRLIGYETRVLKREDFNNDKVDAGDIGAGHSVTAIYEITPADTKAQQIDDRRYVSPTQIEAHTKSAEYAFVKIRYKLPEQDISTLIETPVLAKNTVFNDDELGKLLNQETQFASAVAGFAQLLKDDRYLGGWDLQDALALAQQHKGEDIFGYRTEFVQLVRKAMVAADM